MGLSTYPLLDGTAKRNPLNLFAVAQAENNPLGTWVEHTTSTPIPAQNATNSVPSPFNGYSGVAGDSPWAYGNRLQTVGGSTYYNAYDVAYGTDLIICSIFVRRAPTTPATVFTIGLESTTGAGLTHGHRFNWNSGANNWALTTNFGGARGFVDPVWYDNGWRRVGCIYQNGLDTGYTETSLTTDLFSTFFYPGPTSQCDVWGHMLERRTALTPMSTADLSAYLIDKQIRAAPYLTGLCRSGDQLVFNTLRESYGPGKIQMSMKTTPNAAMAVLGRVDQSAPWSLVLAQKVEGDMNADGTLSATALAHPQMRLAITEMNNTTTTLGAWYSE